MTSQNLWDDLWGSPELEKPLKSSGYNSVKMAQYFQQYMVGDNSYTGFGIVNIQALSSQMARWKKSGLAQDVLYAMIHRYFETTKTPTWQDFVTKRDTLLAEVTTVDETPEVKYDDSVDEFDEEQAMRDYLARRNK